MRFLFNATTNTAGGGAKNSAVFIKHAVRTLSHEWHFAVSPQVAGIVATWGVPQSRMTVVEQSPARSREARRELEALQRKGDFDLVYTMAGPAYVTFSCPHVMGISNPYISHVDLGTFLSTRPARRWLPDALKIIYQSGQARKADRIVFQTETARASFCNRLRYPFERTEVVSNAFDAESFAGLPLAGFASPLKVLVPSMAYPHKLLDQVPGISAACRRISDGCQVEFLLTIDPSGAEWAAIAKDADKLGVAEHIRTLGSYNYADAGGIFAQADIILSLSVLETFSATPLEAFGAERPHISADRSWSREIGGAAALYVDPRDPSSVARAINEIAGDEALRNQLVTAGRVVLKKYGDHSARFVKLLQILEAEAGRHQR